MLSPPFDNPFRFSGPVSERAALILRSAVFETVRNHIARSEYVSLLAPRQSGKTTFLTELSRLGNNDHVYVDFAGFQCDRLREVVNHLGQRAGVAESATAAGSLAECLDALMQSRKVVFLLDEVCTMGHVTVKLFRALRAYHGESVVGKRRFHLFVMADSIDPLDLTLRDNPQISPYNIGHPVYLEDFSLREVRDFIRSRSGGRISETCIDRVFQHTRGHPYLMQYLCSHLYALPSGAAEKQVGDIGTLVDASRVDESDNVQSLVRHIQKGRCESRPEMETLARVFHGEKIHFTLLDEAVKKLYLEYGCVRNEQDVCVIRNPIYRLVLERNRGMLPPRTAPRPSKARVLNEVFVSYAWTAESKSIADQVCSALKKRGIKVLRDREAVPFRASIGEFMKRMGRGKCVIVVLSKRYLESPNCMFELMEIARHGGMRKRVFPLFLPDAKISTGEEKLVYVKYWEKRTRELDAKMKKVMGANLTSIRKELDRCVAIRAGIDGILERLGDMNALSLQEHQESSFAGLAQALEGALSELPDTP